MKTLFYMVWCLLFLPLSGETTTVRSFTFDALCQTAQSIAHVKCLEKYSLLLPGRDGVFTKYRFEVLSGVKGRVGDEIVLILPGGKVEGKRLKIVGMPEFSEGQEMVLFLSENDAYGSPWPVGLDQGCYGVRVGDGGTRQVVFQRQNPINPALRSKPIVEQKLPLKTFLDTIEGVLNIEKTDDQMQ